MIGKTNIPMGMSKGETVSILLKTNQSSNEDLNGVKVVVSYNDESHEYAYNGQFSVEIPKDKTYTVTFGEVDGYKTPSSVTYTAVKGFSRSVEAMYYSEFVTVNVSTEDGINVDNKAYIYVSTFDSLPIPIVNGTATFNIPYDETYTVSLSDMDGYTTPESQTFTASQPNREISMEYKKAVEHVIVNVSSDDYTDMDGYKVYVRPNVANGAYIQDVDGNLYTESEWDTTKVANGIAVVTDECSFVLALEDIGDKPQWSSSISMISLTHTDSEEEAVLDYNGLGNTVEMLNTGVSDENTAVQYCSDYRFLNGQLGYLGAAGEWDTVARFISEINELLSVVGGASIASIEYWTSTAFYTSVRAWTINPVSGALYYRHLDTNNAARAFTKLGSSYTITNGKVEFDVPPGVEYTISVEDVDGYTTPEPQSFVAESGTRTVNMVYKEVKLGVFIQGVSGKLYETEAWTSQETPNGVAVITEECSFVIALTESYTMRIHSSASGALENYMTAIPNETQAKADYDGAANTANIIKLQNGINYAAGWCDDFLFPSLRYGFLPSLGQMWAAYSNKSAVDAALNKAGGMELFSDYYWTSTFRGMNNTNRYRLCWTLVWSNGVVSSSNLYTYFRVRAFSDL